MKSITLIKPVSLDELLTDFNADSEKTARHVRV